ESEMVKKLRIKQINSGVFTAVGLSEIEPGASGLQMIPLKFRTWGELDYVREKIRPMLEERLHAKGFEVLFWGDAGWVRFFSKEAATRPVEFQQMKMFTWAGDATQLSLMEKMGYQPVPLETSDILLGLNTNMITTVPLPPLLALAARINGPAPHMLEMNWVPIVGACVVRTDVWEKIPPELRAKLLASAEEIGTGMRTRGREEGDEAVRAMQQHGLQVHPMTPQSTREWQAQVEKLYPAIRGSLVPAEIFDAVDHHLAEFRAKNQP
ncbi:MAG TPA: TRAP transporter substrate-binding protein DctP, partial [Steroidobacteraceae bacterium]|nr:TRAP transporter substrate-binding protein DctP [Steroidobacteraceae bacterium]